ncbi:MAG: hypothetical protein R3F59_20355 [Myxococcota bacterium]
MVPRPGPQGRGTRREGPHGTQGQGEARDEAAWIVDCAQCHPDDVHQYTCSDACHAEIFVEPRLAYHLALDGPGDDANCTSGGCHPHADLRGD